MGVALPSADASARPQASSIPASQRSLLLLRTGIGYEVVRRLAEHRGRVVMAGRNEDRCEE